MFTRPQLCLPLLILLLAAAGSIRAQVFSDKDFVTVKKGTYVVGAEGNEINPRRSVELGEYRILRREVTNREFARFVEATGYETVAERTGRAQISLLGMEDWEWDVDGKGSWRYPHGSAGPCADTLPDHPVTQVSFEDALAFCAWAGVRLPTLEEWEVAARAGDAARYPWGDSLTDAIEDHANIWEGTTHEENTAADGFIYTAPVMSYRPNAWGIYDVLGNVFEFCEGKIVPDAEERRLICARGGSWWCSAGTCSFFNLVDIGAMVRVASLSNHGFRVVR